VKIKTQKIRFHQLLKHKTKKHVLINFLIVLFIFVVYFGFITLKYGFKDGFYVTALTWSFFVLCTPIADAGFLLDFPFRLITHIKMLFSEITVWVIAISLNIYTVILHPEIYERTKILSLLKHILEKPFPFWIIVIVSAIGTFMSVYFGDEMMDKINHKDRLLHKKHKRKHKYIIMFFIVVLSIIIYDFLLKQLGIKISL
jgi:hypothetical protein